jgi:hypothetical protein
VAAPGVAKPRITALNRSGSLLRECDAVALASLEHIGKSYRTTRELQPNLIDCSTVVSQAHWIGAAVQTPFIAESQRTATNARVIELDDLLPGDAIYAYPARADAPGGRHNHVALYLGIDDTGTPWAIESREDSGAVLVPLESLRFGGGVRRFCPNPLTPFNPGEWSDLVQRVPKLGRLGARLTARYGTSLRHRGVDIYVSPSSRVVSPLSGSIEYLTRISHSGYAVGVWASESGIYSIVGPVKPTPGLHQGMTVQSGEFLGHLARGAGPGGCNVVPSFPGLSRIHWELWSPREFGTSPAPDLRCEWLPSFTRQQDRYVAQSCLYDLKIGRVDTCIADWS